MLGILINLHPELLSLLQIEGSCLEQVIDDVLELEPSVLLQEKVGEEVLAEELGGGHDLEDVHSN